MLAGSIGGLYSLGKSLPYAVAKSGLIGMNNAVALEGADKGIRCNMILPGAMTRMGGLLDTEKFPPCGPELVAPVVAWLAHESCSVTGEMYVAMAGRMARAMITETEGVFQSVVDQRGGRRAGSARSAKARACGLSRPSHRAFQEHMGRSFEMARKGGA